MLVYLPRYVLLEAITVNVRSMERAAQMHQKLSLSHMGGLKYSFLASQPLVALCLPHLYDRYLLTLQTADRWSEPVSVLDQSTFRGWISPSEHII